jgi:predicted RNA binding protein YcfA (HicA-like mRNA interferase family)
MANEQRSFIINFAPVSDAQKLTRSREVIESILEAYYSSNHHTPKIHNYDDLLNQTAEMLYRDPHDTRAIQFLYTYLVQVGSEKMEQLLQDLGHTLVNEYDLQFEYVERLLNMAVKRLAALGRLRAMQRGDHLKFIHHGGLVNADRMMRGDW